MTHYRGNLTATTKKAKFNGRSMLFLSSTIYFLLHFLSVIGNLNVKGYNFFRRKAPEEAVVPDAS